jgi:hypothetical protein
MFIKYESFLLENIKSELSFLLEGYIYGSSEFLFKIKTLSKEPDSVGRIASCIYTTIEYERWFLDREIKQNYFDLTDSDDKVSFIQNYKLPDDFDNEETPSLPYEMVRNEIKIGRIAKYICKISGLSVKDSDIESFVNSYKASKVDNTKEFKLVSGEDIGKYYKHENYYAYSGTLGNSCMSESSKSTFKIYTQNPDKVKLLVYLDGDDKVHARALVWKLDKSPSESEYFMDRVYANRDSDVTKLISFAKENNWMYKRIMNGHVSTAVEFIYNNEVIYGEINIELDNLDFSKYPYLDTLPFLSKKKKRLSNTPQEKSYFLHSVDGDCDRCDDCGGYVILTHYDDERFCDKCGEGHETLAKKGIETKWNMKIKKS